MTVNLQMPSETSQTLPGELNLNRPWVFDCVPDIRRLLPKERGRPGLEYMQCCVVNLRRAQDEGWVEVENTVVYTIAGPKGAVDMKLLARGKITPGQPHNSGARLCYCDKTVELLTGLWINPNKHQEPDPEPDPAPAMAKEKKDAA